MHTTSPSRLKHSHLWIGALILLAHIIWYLGVWPGPIGEDGYSLISNLDTGTPKYTGKEAAWLLYAMATYLPTWRVEAVIIPLLLLQVAILTRMLTWIAQQGYRKTALFFLITIACTPHVLNFNSSLYPDAVFSLTFIGVLFEVWLALRAKKISRFGLIAIGVMLPCAAFFKANGIIIFLPVFYLAYRLSGWTRWILVALCIFWVAVVQIGTKIYDLGRGHGAIMPLVIYETVNFMQTRPMNLYETRHMVTDETRRIMHQHISQQDIDTLFDRDYWDTLWHSNHDRVTFRHITAPDQRLLRKEFFTYNLWRNIPAFTASRVNIFLAAALAQGGMIWPSNAQHYLGKRLHRTPSAYNAWGLQWLPEAVDKIYFVSYNWRFILWAPFVGIFLIFACLTRAWQQRDADALCISATLLVQLGGIFIFSTAAEYRYLLPIFFSPLLLVPLYYQQKSSIP